MSLIMLVLIFISGIFLKQKIDFFIHNGNNYLDAFLYILLASSILDFIIKSLKKKGNVIPQAIRRFPNSEKKILVFQIIKELFSIWNFYLVIFFLYYITQYIQTHHGIIISIISYLIIYIVQLFNTQLIYHINMSRHSYIYTLSCIFIFSAILFGCYKMHFPHTSLLILYCSIPILATVTLLLIKQNYLLCKYLNSNTPQNANISLWTLKTPPEKSIANYILFSIKMFMRSPLFRKQLISYAILTTIYLYIYYQLGNRTEISFVFNVISIFLISTSFPLIFNQYLFSAEASFFDHFMIIPQFKNILLARYILCLCMSLIPVSLLFLLVPLTFTSTITLISAIVYALGTITLLSFSSLLVADTKIELSISNLIDTSPPLGQSLVILATYSISATLIFILSLVSTIATIYSMFIIGILSIISSNRWFNFLYKKFYSNRYEKMEKYREQ